MLLVEATVDLATGTVVGWVDHDDVRPALGFEESFTAIIALHEHDGFKAALAARGITDLTKVQIDPWPTGSFGIEAEDGRRVVRCICYYREQPGDNGYARPIEGLLVLVDMARGEVLEIIDHGRRAHARRPRQLLHRGPARRGTTCGRSRSPSRRA